MAGDLAHPVNERRPPLPAIALTATIGELAHALRVHARRGDILLVLAMNAPSTSIDRAVAVARDIGMLVVACTGKEGGSLAAQCDQAFVIPDAAAHRIQATHVVLVHVLWDAIHVLRGEQA